MRVTRSQIVHGVTDYIKEGLSEEEQLQHLTDVLHDKVYELKNLIK